MCACACVRVEGLTSVFDSSRYQGKNCCMCVYTPTDRIITHLCLFEQGRHFLFNSTVWPALRRALRPAGSVPLLDRQHLELCQPLYLCRGKRSILASTCLIYMYTKCGRQTSSSQCTECSLQPAARSFRNGSMRGALRVVRLNCFHTP